MRLCRSNMDNIREKAEDGKMYFVHGSGLIAVPYGRLNDVPMLKAEFHQEEVRKAMLAARARKLA